MLRVSGTAGAVRVGYQVAAQLGAWRLELLPVVPKAYRVEAQIRAVSEYWLAQTPLDLVLDMGTQQWTWRAITPAIGDARLTATIHGTPAVTPTTDVAPVA